MGGLLHWDLTRSANTGSVGTKSAFSLTDPEHRP
jgi:hypothetical protein